MAIVLRNKKCHLRREVPVRFASVEERRIIWLSLHTGDQDDAVIRAAVAWRQLIDGWQARLDGDGEDAERRFHAASDIAPAVASPIYLLSKWLSALVLQQFAQLEIHPSADQRT